MADKSVKYLVVDSGAFIRNAPIKDIGDEIYTVKEVVTEIRDKSTRERLRVLPYQIIFREPSTEAIRKVTDFSKKTGDYHGLSAVDIRVLALVYLLEKEVEGTEHLKTIPDRNITWNTTTRHQENPTKIAGFYLKKGTSDSTSTSRTTSECISESPCIADIVQEGQLAEAEELPAEGEGQLVEVSEYETDVADMEAIEDKPGSCDNIDEGEQKPLSDSGDGQDKVHIDVVDSKDENSSEESVGVRRFAGEGDIIPTDRLEDSEEDEDSMEEDDDEDGWITPSNIKAIQMSMGGKNIDKAEVSVGCMTTDYAMQNVLIQMGLHVVSVDGLLIKQARSFVLRCYGCYKIITDMSKQFCPHCGNKTLQKVSMTVDDDGSVRYFLSRRRPVNTRGMKYSLPAPKGGKHACNPILVADQPQPQQRAPRSALIKYDVMDPDYIAHTSPFAPNDVYSRASQLGRSSRESNFHNKRNQNENKKRSGRRK